MPDPDCVKMMALGDQQFAVGTLYNYAEDIIVPNMLLWDPDDVANSIVVKTETKKNVKDHSMATEQTSDDDEDDETEHRSWLSDLGMDDHAAISLMTGILRPSSGGAWQYAADWADWKAETFGRKAEVAVHCCSSSKKVSAVDSKTQLEIICHPEKIMKSGATHVVVAVTYGLEAFCIFSRQQPKSNTTTNDDDEVIERMRIYARIFADRLMDDRNHLEADQDQEGDEEDGGQCFIPLDLQCILYSDLNQVKNGAKSWTSKPVAEQYEACRAVMRHPVNKAIPVKVLLYPLGKLMPNVEGKLKIPPNVRDVSPNLVLRCQMIWNRLQRIRWDTDDLIDDLRGYHCKPLMTYKRIMEFGELITKYVGVLLKALAQWTISVRRGEITEEDVMAKKIKAVETQSPFLPNELKCWLNRRKQQIKTFKKLDQLPNVRLVSGVKNLKKELRNGNKGSYAVVISLTFGMPDALVNDMKSYVEKKCWTKDDCWTERDRKAEAMMESSTLTHCRKMFVAAQEFSNWVTNNNSDNTNVQYIILYDERIGVGEISPSTKIYDCGTGTALKFNSTFESNFTIPKAPGPVTVEKNHRGVITLSWTTEEEIEQSKFLLQYRNVGGSGERWDSIQHHSKSITINYLQSEESYVFRVAAVTPGGRSPFGPVSCEVTIDPVCPPPSELLCRYVTDTSITISWSHQFNSGGVETVAEEDEDNSEKDEDEYSGYNDYDDDEDYDQYYDDTENQEAEVTISSYSIDCWMGGSRHESTFIQRSTTEKTITLEPLVPGTDYYVQVRAVCTDATGSNFFSKASQILETKTLREAERAALVVRRESQKCSTAKDIDLYQIPLKRQRGVQTQGVGHYVFGESKEPYPAGKRRQRTILMLGATGSGKSTLINAMVNYMLGIEWNDDFRFKLIDEPADKSQAHSQTDLVTTYDLYEMKGSRLNYSLTVVDTPGFGDTRGLEKDKKIMQQIQDYFQCRHGIQQLDAVCFVVQSSLPRLTSTQKYIFDSILSIFGQDIKDNIRLMVTFSDGALPPVLGAVKEAGIPSPMDPATGLPLHHKFNNSCFFETNKGDVRQAYFDMAVSGFDEFFDDLSRMESKSLALTREVLSERKRLESLVEALKQKNDIKLTLLDELEQVKKILVQNEDQMDANKVFEFERLVPKATDISGTGQFTTNCQKCRTTCHFPCRQAHDVDKHRCSVMDRFGNCIICKCPWNVHFNQKYRYEMVKEKVQRSSDAIRQQYQGAKNEAITNEQLLKNIQKESDECKVQLRELKQAANPCIQRLNKIALRPHSSSVPDYIDVMIAAEKQEHRRGYQKRIANLNDLRQMADITAKLFHNNSKSKIMRAGRFLWKNRMSLWVSYSGRLLTLVCCLLPGLFWNASPVESWVMARTKCNI
ncbi:hypothetical protein DAPPUDRAFT_263562 [Daphnia pulex]|uniref:Fibronectin type-III domain-containing protein n=1 Tax=Daphnia pulex TaxID=6669 RepID=E9HQ00_DAPPU|nr:hypothetical protein DAPPUDRAFT_263562 [Daphnia pulex]|eukprot:EFX66158.1 hypothetical protein DAPPUDRAFT_263562 [Daphnia pulex]